MQTALSATVVTSRSSSMAASGSNRVSTQSNKSRKPVQRGRSPTRHFLLERAGVLKSSSLPTDPITCEVEPAIAGNHLAIQSFLQRLLHRPSNAEFASAIQRPGYEPADRLIIRSPSDRSLIAHAQLESQVIRFGRSEIPVVRVKDLAVLPEFRQRGFDDRMIAAVEAEAKRRGAMMVVARGEDFNLLQRHGWSILGSDPVSIVSPQRLLGQLPEPRVPESPFYASQMPEVQVRLGRLTDVDDLKSVFEQRHGATTGTLVRSEESWSWIISKRAHDRIYIYSENGQTLAYAVVRGASILELVDLTEDARGSAGVVKFAASDAIEHGRHSLRIHAPLTERVHEWADNAGGQVFASATDDGWMAKCISNRTLLRRLANEMYRRRPGQVGELGIHIDGEELLIKKGVRSMKVTRGSAVERIGLTQQAALQLFLGYRTARELAADGQLLTTSDEAMRKTIELFPSVMQWRTRWDDMPVMNS